MADEDFHTILPQDVIFQILTKLPTRTLLHLRCVCKSFLPLITHPHFLKLHLSAVAAAAGGGGGRHHLLYYESSDYTKSYFSFLGDGEFSLRRILETPFKSVNGYLRVVGSDRGVVCLFDTNYFTFVGTLVLWNPFIGKFKIVPSLRRVDLWKKSFSHMAVGFGFDPRVFDFKVVKILYGCDKEHESPPEAFVYASKIGSWRSVGMIVPCFMPKNWFGNVVVDGVVHWLAYRKPQFSSQPNCIMGFDLANETFNLIELPRNLGVDCMEMRLSPTVDERSVALFVTYRENLREMWELWLMNDYGKVESWTRKYHIVLGQAFYPLKIVNGGEILASSSDDKLVLVDVEKDQVKDLEVSGLAASFNAVCFMPSLALVDIGDQLVE